MVNHARVFQNQGKRGLAVAVIMPGQALQVGRGDAIMLMAYGGSSGGGSILQVAIFKNRMVTSTRNIAKLRFLT